MRPALSRKNARCARIVCTAVSALLLASCGGGGGEPAANPGPALRVQPSLVIGADGAAVNLSFGQPEVTVRVACDATGAPPLAAMQEPAGAIYQFSPLGLAVGEAEIRVPFDAARAGANPQLAVAQPGGLWAVVSEARQEGGFLVARVPQLSFAVALAGASAQPVATGGIRAQSASPARPRLTVTPTTPITQTAAPWNLLAVQQPQTLAFDVELSDAAACASPYSVEMRAVVIRPTKTPGALFGWLQIVPIGTQAIASSQGKVSFARPFSTADNGNWFFTATATCRRAAAQPVPVAYLAVAPRGYTVNIAAGELPVIATQPVDQSVIEGDSASFSASASGGTGVQWERSNDGGATYAAVPGATGVTLTFATTLADNGALLRLRASNATGSVFSNAARLAVAERVIAPTISVDPVNQSVIEGETASFTVAGSGKPVPTVQWQQRAGATGAWGDIPGATASTYTTPPLPLSDSGTQIRALLTNRGGQAESLVATLTVRPRIIAPAIVFGPQDAVVPAPTGQAGSQAFFSVTATGTAPLSYRWLLNGSPSIFVLDLGSSAFVFVNAADIGQPITVTVEVSNSAGTASASATLTVTRAGVTIGTAGGQVDASDGSASLSVPAGSLAADAFISLTRSWSGGIVLPEGTIALTDAYRIEPDGLVFAPGRPATLRLTSTSPIGEPAPAGRIRVLARIRDARPGELRADRARTATAGPRATRGQPTLAPNAGRMALPQQANVQRLAARPRAGKQTVVTLPNGQVAELDCSFSKQVGVDSFTVPISGTYVVLETSTDACVTPAQPSVEYLTPPFESGFSFPGAGILPFNSPAIPWWATPAYEDDFVTYVEFRNSRPAVLVWQHQFPGSTVWEDLDPQGTYFGVAPLAPEFNRANLTYLGRLPEGVHRFRAAISQSLLFDPVTGAYAGYQAFDSFGPVTEAEFTAQQGSTQQYPTIQPALTPAANPAPARQPPPQPANSLIFGEIYLQPDPVFPGQYRLRSELARFGLNNFVDEVRVSASGVGTTTPVIARRNPAGGLVEAVAYVRNGTVEAQIMRQGQEGEVIVGAPVALFNYAQDPDKLALAFVGARTGFRQTEFVLAAARNGVIELKRFGQDNFGAPVSPTSQTLPGGPCSGYRRLGHLVSADLWRATSLPATDATRAALLFQGQNGDGSASTCVALLRGDTWSVELLWTSPDTDLTSPEAPTNAVDISPDGTVVVAEIGIVEDGPPIGSVGGLPLFARGRWVKLALHTESGGWQVQKSALGPGANGAPDVAFDANGVINLAFASSYNSTGYGEFTEVVAVRLQPDRFSEFSYDNRAWLLSYQQASSRYTSASEPRLSVNSRGDVLLVFTLDATKPGAVPTNMVASRLFKNGFWADSIETVAGVNGSRRFDPWMERNVDINYTPSYFGEGLVFWLETDPADPSGTALRRARALRR